jgi:FliZ protein
VRLRRLGQHLTTQDISRDLLKSGYLDENLEPWLPVTSTNNYRIALRKYAQFKAQVPVVQKQKVLLETTSDIY